MSQLARRRAPSSAIGRSGRGWMGCFSFFSPSVDVVLRSELPVSHFPFSLTALLSQIGYRTRRSIRAYACIDDCRTPIRFFHFPPPLPFLFAVFRPCVHRLWSSRIPARACRLHWSGGSDTRRYGAPGGGGTLLWLSRAHGSHHLHTRSRRSVAQSRSKFAISFSRQRDGFGIGIT